MTVLRSLPIVLTALCLASALGGQPVPVHVERTADGYRLVRDGRPYFVRGAGGTSHLEALAAAGGNSVRTWGSDQTERVLDEAHRLGMTVTAGLWLVPQRHGMDYRDPVAVAAQHERVLAEVRRFKDHPALLAWGIGNELELAHADPAVWDAVGALARDIRAIDPHHPTMTVTAFVEEEVVREIRARAPDLQILGINVYGGLEGLEEAVRRVGWEGPWLATEWGPNGPWEVSKTDWGAAREPSSTTVARVRARRHAILETTPACLGGYVFLWGQKYETTPTWFGLFLKDGTPLEGVDALALEWGGCVPGGPAPRVEGIVLGDSAVGEGIEVAAGEFVEARLVGRRPDCAAAIEWSLRRDDHRRGIGGDIEEIPAVVTVEKVGEGDFGTVRFRAPEQPGPHRLYVVLRTAGRAAVANVPLLVR